MLPLELIKIILKIKWWTFRRRLILYIQSPFTILHYCFITDLTYYLSFHETTINLGVNYLLVYRFDDDLNIRVVLLKKKNRLLHWETLFFHNIDY